MSNPGYKNNQSLEGKEIDKLNISIEKEFSGCVYQVPQNPENVKYRIRVHYGNSTLGQAPFSWKEIKEQILYFANVHNVKEIETAHKENINNPSLSTYAINDEKLSELKNVISIVSLFK